MKLTEDEWEKLRRVLSEKFDEDIVQQTILELLEHSAAGVVVLNPLHWCRKTAKRRTISALRSVVWEREMKEGLTVLHIPYDTRTKADLRSARNRRHHRRKKEAA